MRNFIALIVFGFAMFVNSSCSNTADMVSPTPQAAQTGAQTESPDGQSSYISQDSAALPTDDIFTIPDGPEKLKRIRALEKQMLGTVGWVPAREWGYLAFSRGPREDRLYTLHKKLTDSDWVLLAEMYINSSFDDVREDYNYKDIGRLKEAMRVLLAMNGQDSIDTLEKIIDRLDKRDTTKNFLRLRVDNHIKEYMDRLSL